MRQEFPAKTKVAAFQRANGRCEHCTARLVPGNVEYDHRVACELGGSNDPDNCVAVCRACHARKTKRDVTAIAKAKRRERRHAGIRKPSRFAASRDSKWKKKIDGSVVLR